MEKSPVLAIIIPTYGRVTSVCRLLHALEKQTLVPLEIVVVDQNASGILDIPDNSITDHKICHLHQEQPNVSRARNIGFVASTAPYILFLDDDLVPEPDFCANGLATLISVPEIRCLCPTLISSQCGEDNLVTLQRNSSRRRPSLVKIKETLTAAMFFERDYYRATGGCDDLLYAFARAGEDQELFLRMRRRNMQVWLDRNLYIFHDEAVPGGCELRTSPYWTTRQKCIRTWTLRRRIHAEQGGRLKFSDAIGLLRSTVLNRTLIRRPLRDTFHDLALLRQALEESKQFLASVPPYPKVDQIDHLQPYFQSSDSCHMAASA